ncbi:MAG TPA: histidine kinase [Sphingomicrobium sp.]|nr:histidine kinase [Sphingomicrobium sp.]
MEHVLDPAGRKWRSALTDWRVALRSIAFFWLFYFATVLLRGLLSPEAASAIGYRAINTLLGVALSLLMYVALAFARGGGVRRMAIVASIAAIPAAAILSVVSLHLSTQCFKEYHRTGTVATEGFTIFNRCKSGQAMGGNRDGSGLNPLPSDEALAEKKPRMIADGMVTWYFLFAAWSAIFIAMTQQQLARLTERRLADAETAAHIAQVRALRYQVNPHFLFNTLNSLSSLVMTGRADRAEEMLMALSHFFRTSLSLDPSANVTLAEEIALQQLYLKIEKVRFPDRLRVVIDVPEDLGATPVPALILQPLVENAIKYGVSATRDPMELTIAARRLDGGRIQIDVINQLVIGAAKVPAPAPAHDGTGLGLSNVCQRLHAHYGDRADCRFGPIAGGYQVSLAIPIDSDD